jgi:hypothetical protein
MSKARRAATTARKKAGRTLKNASRTPKNASRGLKNASRGAGDADASGIKPPAVPTVVLHAPERSGRALVNRERALQNAESRLLLAWKYRKELDPALPADFHPRAWTALHTLRSHDPALDSAVASSAAAPATGAPAADDTAAATPMLEALVGKLGRIRNVIELTSRPGDAVRKDFAFGTALQPSTPLLALAPTILRAADRWRAKFPALTPALLHDSAAALQTARSAVRKRRGHAVGSAVDHADHADEDQIALDVLLDSVDHLRAAALVTFADSRPQLSEALAAPLEPYAHGHRADAAPAAPPPASPASPTAPSAH